MFDRSEMYKRFAEFFPVENPNQLAKFLKLAGPTVEKWEEGHTKVPWKRLKKLVDDQGVSWDYLVEGTGPKLHPPDPERTGNALDKRAINARFFSLVPKRSNAQIGKLCGVIKSAVSNWRSHAVQVPWHHLRCAVDHNRATWEWLLEGRGDPPPGLSKRPATTNDSPKGAGG